MTLPFVGITAECDKYGPLALLATPFSSSTDDGVWFCKHPHRLMRLRESIENLEKKTGPFTLVLRATPTASFHILFSQPKNICFKKTLKEQDLMGDDSLFNILRAPEFEGLHHILKRGQYCLDKKLAALIGGLS